MSFVRYAPMPEFIPVAEPNLGALEEQFLLDAFRSGWISSRGGYIDRFEREFATFCESEHAVAVANGTVALHVALIAAGVGPGDEVILPALTFVATAAAVKHAGAEPVFVDSEAEIGTMDPAAVERAISSRTKAVIAVHLYGHPVEMDPIMDIVRRHNLVVVEDAAEAHGARYKGRVVGGIGHLATFSFYGNKIITTGEGGMVVTRDERYESRVRFLKDHAMDRNRRYWHPEVGFNYRMTNLQAAIGCAQLARHEEIKSARHRILSDYRTLAPELCFNPCKAGAEPAVWLISVLLSGKRMRDRAAEALRERRIDTRPYFPLLSDMPPYSGCRVISAKGESALPVARDLSERGMNLPSSSHLTVTDVQRVVSSLNESCSQ